MRRVVRKVARDPEPDEDYDDEPVEDEDQEPEEDEEEADVVRSGWSGYDETKAKSGAYAEFLRLEKNDQTLIKFLETGPFASYRQHWIEGLTSTRKKSFVCREDDCSLCDAGDDPGFKVAFNVLVLPAGNKPLNKVWEVGPRLAEAIKGKAKDKRYGPLDRPDVYWAVGRTGEKSKTQYSLDSVKARDLEEDWETSPLSEAELQRYKKKIYDKKVIRVPTVRQLKEIAAELSEDEADDDDD